MFYPTLGVSKKKIEIGESFQPSVQITCEESENREVTLLDQGEVALVTELHPYSWPCNSSEAFSILFWLKWGAR